MGPGPLTEAGLREHIFPLFSRVLAREELYLANHSLGRPLDQLEDDLREFASPWFTDMDDAWGPWMEELARFRASIAKLIGLSRPDAVVPKAAAGQGLRAVLNSLPADGSLRPLRLVATRGEFDALDFVLKMYEDKGRTVISWIEPSEDSRSGLPLIDAGDVVRAIRPGVDLVIVSEVFYSTGQVLEGLESIIRGAHAAGALVLVDLYHSAGVIPGRFDELGPDFAVGGSYKYTRGGPGPGWLAIHPRHLVDGTAGPGGDAQPALRTLDTGWFAKKDTFGFQRPTRPLLSSGGDAWLENTPAPVIAYQARAGLELVLAIGVARLRTYSLEQQAFLEGELKKRGVAVRHPDPHGAFLLVPSPDAPGLVRRLKERKVNTDARLGQVRLCPDILTTRDEMARASDIVAAEQKHR
ncbi:MAG: aminotransferase class V-fold PLP-dependent enzyme [Phycisphaerales bacterium]|nr:aminotransferase class V-fold PLP-dependent enzyme [Phycisphaerales bacterium]